MVRGAGFKPVAGQKPERFDFSSLANFHALPARLCNLLLLTTRAAQAVCLSLEVVAKNPLSC